MINMKKYFLTAIICFATILLANAQEKLTDDQQNVRKTVINMFQALADRDLDKLKKYCTSDIIILENGSAWNLDTLVQKVNQNKSTDFKRINTIDFIDTKVDKNIAWTTYNNQAEVTKNGQHGIIKWLETAILIREGKQWKIKVLHSTLLKKTTL